MSQYKITMPNVMNTVKSCLICAFLCTWFCLQALAADIDGEETGSSEKSETSIDAFVEIGLSLGTSKLPLIGFNEKDSIEESTDATNYLDILVDGRFLYKKFFIEFFDNTFSNITFGYTLTESENGNIELIGTNLFFKVERKNVPGLESIKDRKDDFNLGLRSSIFSGNNIAQFELMTNVTSSHSGVVGSMQVGRQKQIRNWNLLGIAGVRYFSDDVVDYYIGVPSDEASETVEEYKGKAGFMPSFQVEATLPLSERWIFKAQAEYSLIPDSFADSPLAQGDVAYAFRTSIGYVFGNP